MSSSSDRDSLQIDQTDDEQKLMYAKKLTNLLTQFITSMSKVFPEDKKLQSYKLTFDPDEMELLGQLHSDFQEHLHNDVLCSKSILRLTGQKPTFYSLVHMEMYDELIEFINIDLFNDINMKTKWSEIKDNEESAAAMEKVVFNIAVICRKAHGLSSRFSDMPSKEAIQEDMENHPGEILMIEKSGADVSFQKTSRDSIKTFITHLDKIFDMNTSSDTCDVTNVVDDIIICKKTILDCIERNDITTLLSLPINIFDNGELLKQWRTNDIDNEEEWKAEAFKHLAQILTLFEINTAVPDNVMNTIEDLSQDIFNSIQGGNFSLGNLNIHKICSDLSENINEDDLKNFSKNIPEIMNSISTLGKTIMK